MSVVYLPCTGCANSSIAVAPNPSAPGWSKHKDLSVAREGSCDMLEA